MKKIKLNLQNIEGVEELSRAQLKTIFGGTSTPPPGSGVVCETASKSCVVPRLNLPDVPGKCGMTEASGPRLAHCSCKAEGYPDYADSINCSRTIVPPM